MTKTKQITEGAMMLAITGALIMIDRYFSFFFEDIILLLIPIELVIYFEKYGKKSCYVFALTFLVLLLFGNLTTYLYLPVGIIVGLGICSVLNKRTEDILITTILLFCVSEVVISLFLMPLLGISIESQFDGNFTRWTLSTFIFMVVFIGFLESWLTLIIWRKIATVSKTKVPEKINLFEIDFPRKIKLILMFVLLLFPMFFYLNTGNLYYLLLSLWSFCYISLFIIGFTETIKIMAVNRINPLMKLFVLFTFPISIPLLGVKGR